MPCQVTRSRDHVITSALPIFASISTELVSKISALSTSIIPVPRLFILSTFAMLMPRLFSLFTSMFLSTVLVLESFAPSMPAVFVPRLSAPFAFVVLIFG